MLGCWAEIGSVGRTNLGLSQACARQGDPVGSKYTARPTPPHYMVQGVQSPSFAGTDRGLKVNSDEIWLSNVPKSYKALHRGTTTGGPAGDGCPLIRL